MTISLDHWITKPDTRFRTSADRLHKPLERIEVLNIRQRPFSLWTDQVRQLVD